MRTAITLVLTLTVMVCLAGPAAADDFTTPAMERIVLQCGNAAGDLEAPLAQFCIRFMAEAQGLTRESLQADSCGACIDRCSKETRWYGHCTRPCASACGLEQFMPRADAVQTACMDRRQ